jgi:hypothetical protein
MYIPAWIIVCVLLVMAGLSAWLIAILRGRNPLPFPDPGSRIFTAPSAEAKAAVVALLREHGLSERFRFDTGGVERSIMWDGTIINWPAPQVMSKLGAPAASIGLVAKDPVASAEAAAAFLRTRGFQAAVVTDAEPELPIAFVTTDALSGTVLNFRKHVIHLPRPTSVRG